MSRVPTPQTGKGTGTFRRSQAPTPGDSADALFDVNRLTNHPCPVPGCQAIQLAGQTPPITTCAHDLNPPDDRPYRRPRGCLNRPMPGDLPDDF